MTQEESSESEQAEKPTNRLRGLARHSAIYSLTPILRQIIAVGMTYFFVKDDWLADVGFGIKENVDLWMLGVQQLLGSNVLGAMVRFYYDKKSDSDRASVVTSCTLLITTIAFLICGTACAFSEQLVGPMFGAEGVVEGNNLVRIVQLTMLLIPFQLATLSGLYYLMTIKRSGVYTAIQTAKLLFEICLQFILIGHYGLGVEGFLLSMLAGEAVTSLSLSIWMYRRLGARVDLDILRPILRYALPLIPVGVCQLALHSVDRRLLIELIADKTEAFAQAGIYGLAYKIGFMATMMILGPFIQIFHPWVFDIDDAEERAHHIARVGTWAVLVVGAASLGVILFGRQAIGILASEGNFWEAYRVVPFIAGGYVFWALYHVTQLPLLVAKRTLRLFVINLIALVINVTLNWYLISAFGFVGAGLSTALTFACLAGMGILASRSEAHVPFELKRLAIILGAVIIGGGAALWVDSQEIAGELTLLAAVAIKVAFFGTLVGGLWMAILDRGERSYLVAWVGRRLPGG